MIDSRALQSFAAELEAAKQERAEVLSEIREARGSENKLRSGKKVVSEAKVLARDFSEYSVSASIPEAHVFASQLEKNQLGEAIVERVETRNVAGIDLALPDSVEFRPGVRIRREKRYWTDARGITLPTAEAQARVFGVSKTETHGSFSVSGSYTSANVEVYGLRENASVQVETWTEELEQDPPRIRKVQAHEFLCEQRPTEAQKKFRQIVEDGKNLPKVDRENALRLEVETDQEKAREKKARADALLADRPEAKPVEVPNSPGLFPRPDTSGARVATLADMVKLVQKPVKKASGLSPEAKESIARCEAEILRLEAKLKPLAREVKCLRAKVKARGLIHWGGQWILPEVLYEDRAEKARQIREEIALEKRRIEGIKNTGLPC